jgi:hypothetical protein
MHNPEPPVTFSELMSRTGYFLLHWSMFERALGEAIVDARQRLGVAGGPIHGGLKDRLGIWADLTEALSKNAGSADIVREICAQALQLRDVRNLIVHGLDGGNALPTRAEPAHIRCVVGGIESPTSEIVKYTAHDMEHFIQGADACRRGCRDVRHFNYRL